MAADLREGKNKTKFPRLGRFPIYTFNFFLPNDLKHRYMQRMFKTLTPGMINVVDRPVVENSIIFIFASKVEHCLKGMYPDTYGE